MSGLQAAESLRLEGYEGRLVVVAAENEMPYERPGLSKDFLLGKAGAEDLRLRDDEQYTDLDLEWLGGRRAEKLVPSAARLRLDGGQELAVDGVVVATGSVVRRLPVLTPRRPGMAELRTLDDAIRLRAALDRRPRVVIVGAGLIGTEVASACRELGLQVTIVDTEPLPLRGVVGEPLAAFLREVHEDAGVTMLFSDAVTEVLGEAHVEGVRLRSGAVAECDLLLTAIGVDPATDWLRDSPIKLDDGVVCDSTGATSVPNVVACGDVAGYFDARLHRHVRSQHWTAAMEQPEVAARTLLRPEEPEHYRALPYFWTEQHGLEIQIAGYISGSGSLELLEGSMADRSFQAEIRAGDRLEAVVSVNAPAGFAAHQERLAEEIEAHAQQRK